MSCSEYSYSSALSVRIELLCSTVRKPSPNRATIVAVSEGRPIRNNKAMLKWLNRYNRHK